MVKNLSRLHQQHYTQPRREPLWILVQRIFQDPPALLYSPDLSPLSLPPSNLSSISTTRSRVGSLVQAVGLRCGQEEMGTRNTPSTLPSVSPFDARRSALPKCAEVSTDLANLVGDTTTTANSGIHSLSGSAPPPGPSTPNSSTSSDERGYRHTCLSMSAEEFIGH